MNLHIAPGLSLPPKAVTQTFARRELLDHWLGQLGKAERMVLSYLAGVYPTAATKEEIGQATGYEPSGGGFANAIGKLRTLELITGRGNELRASEELFE